MKKLFLILVIALMPMLEVSAAAGRKTDKRSRETTEIISLINQFCLKDGFEVVKVGSLGMGLAKPILRMALDSSDPDERMVLDLVKGIKKVAVVAYEGCSDEVRGLFELKVSRILSEDSLILNVSDSGDNVKIYGFVSDDGSTMTDFILHSPSESALVCLFGTISLDALTAMVAD